MADDIAIKVENVSKDFRLPHEKVTTIKSLFTGFLRGGLSRTVETQHALQNINFEVKKGEFFGIVGRNGSGKSTLLKILAGVYQPSRGKTTIQGRLVPFVELGVGFNFELTGRENVYLNGALLGFSKDEVAAQYNDIVDFAELEPYMDQKLKNYSSGMQVRLAFSIAVRAQADILLIDEVLAVGDADFQRKCFAYFRSLKKNKKTVVFVSHDMNAIREYCDRAILIENSKIITEGTAAKVAREYTRLFSGGEDEDHEAKTAVKRWGNKDAVFTSVTCVPKKVNAEEEVTITCQVKVNKDIENAQLGFSIKNEADVWLFGTNNKLLGKPVSLKKGQKVQMTWKAPNIFITGTYFINITIENEALVACDWWDEAQTFEVVKETFTGYVIAPPLQLTIN